jgi:hypothetical protein
MSLKRDLELLIIGLIGQILGMLGVVIIVVSMLAELILHVPAGFNLWIGGAMIVVAMIILEIMIRENRKDEQLCQCPCGCRNKRDGLEDLCHYCMETHEDLRREFVAHGA